MKKTSLDELIIHLFNRDADNTMAKMAQKILERENPNIHMVVNKIKETEVAVWYNNKKEFGRNYFFISKVTPNIMTLIPTVK